MIWYILTAVIVSILLFSRYMQNVAYDVPRLYPPQPQNHVWGEAVNLGTQMCLDTMNKPIPANLGVSGCHGYGGNQVTQSYSNLFIVD